MKQNSKVPVGLKAVERMYRRIEEYKKKYLHKVHHAYHMSHSQLMELRFKNDRCDSIIDAYYYGFYMGVKYQQEQSKRNAPAPTTAQGAKQNIQSQDTTELGKSQLGGC